MTRIETKSKRHLSAKFAAGLVVSAFLLLGAFVAPASAENDNGRNWNNSGVVYPYYGRPSYGYNQQYYRQPSYGYNQQYYSYNQPSYGYNQQYYRQPAYGYSQQYYRQPYYAQPSSPGVGIYLPGIGIRIQ